MSVIANDGYTMPEVPRVSTTGGINLNAPELQLWRLRKALQHIQKLREENKEIEYALRCVEAVKEAQHKSQEEAQKPRAVIHRLIAAVHTVYCETDQMMPEKLVRALLNVYAVLVPRADELLHAGQRNHRGRLDAELLGDLINQIAEIAELVSDARVETAMEMANDVHSQMWLLA